jgi:hypothetical protein
MPSDLALTIINEGAGYDVRCKIGRDGAFSREPVDQRYAAVSWTKIATDAARKYQLQFGEPGSVCFTARDILTAAGELAEYYENHARETRENETV